MRIQSRQEELEKLQSAPSQPAQCLSTALALNRGARVYVCLYFLCFACFFSTHLRYTVIPLMGSRSMYRTSLHSCLLAFPFFAPLALHLWVLFPFAKDLSPFPIIHHSFCSSKIFTRNCPPGFPTSVGKTLQACGSQTATFGIGQSLTQLPRILVQLSDVPLSNECPDRPTLSTDLGR